MYDLIIKRGDTGIGFLATLSNEHGPVNLTGADVLFLCGEHRIKCLPHDITNGEVIVVFDKIHTEKTKIYVAEFKVTFKDGRVETFPNDGYLKINIKKDLGGGS